MAGLDYTGRMYANLIESISRNCKSYSIADYCQAQSENRLEKHFVIMRHDADGNMKNALVMAETDARYGIRSTFYFRVKQRLFQPEIIRKIADLGHEIGYHYEVLSDAGGDFEKARELFEKNLDNLREIARVNTACMHGRSFSKHNNLDFWKKYSLESFGLIAEPYLTIDYSDKYYFTDTGLCWDNAKFNRRDIVISKGNMNIRSTPELIAFMNTSSPKKAAMLTHTNNWTDDVSVWIFYKTLFFGVNTVKAFRKTLALRQ